MTNAKNIRTSLKKELGLSARDVSVRKRRCGYSSSITCSIKTMKGLTKYNKIEEIANKEKYYERDEVNNEILSGGNTYIFVEIDCDFKEQIVEKIQEEVENKLSSKPFTLFNKFNVYPFDDGSFSVTIENDDNVARRCFEVQNKDLIFYAVNQVINRENNYEAYSAIQ